MQKNWPEKPETFLILWIKSSSKRPLTNGSVGGRNACKIMVTILKNECIYMVVFVK